MTDKPRRPADPALPDDDRTHDVQLRPKREDLDRALSLLVVGDTLVQTHALPLTGDVVVGRGEEADLVVIVAGMSRRHLRLRLGPKSAQIEDLGSRNGTRVDRVRLDPGTPVPIRLGDVIEVGTTMLILQDRYAPSRPRRVWSHGYFEARLEEECARALRSKTRFALIRIVVDGTDANTVALLKALRPSDIVGSYGPFDYEVLLLECGATEVEDVLRRLRRVGDGAAVVRTGVAFFPQDGHTPEVLTAHACAAVTGRAPQEASGLVVIKSSVMVNLHRLVERVATSEINVLILGETGAGKDVLAERIHSLSLRAKRPIVRLSCANLSESLLESELFGHAKGAFTGATSDKPGLLETAEGGTMFLDEVGELSLPLQARLLRVIEEREIRRLGSTTARPIDVRFVAATNRNLELEVQAGRFRQDLFYRLNGIAITVPPLRQRVDEIVPLAHMFATEIAKQLGRPLPKITADAVALLQSHAWPGNVRELRNVMERAVVLSEGGLIFAEHVSLGAIQGAAERIDLPPDLPLPVLAGPRAPGDSRRMRALTEPGDLKGDLQALERERIVEALSQAGGHQSRAAQVLGISRRTLIDRMVSYGLPRPRKK